MVPIHRKCLSGPGETILSFDYLNKFEAIRKQTLFDRLKETEQRAVQEIATKNRFTLQELKRFVESTIDLNLWGERGLLSSWNQWRHTSDLAGREFKKLAFGNLDRLLKDVTNKEVTYVKGQQYAETGQGKKVKYLQETSGVKIFGSCPVYSDKTLCCNLYTIDAVKNCGFGCSYCSIQSMYTDDNILLDDHFGEKLDAIELDPNRRYHIGTGQSSDALMWGNTNGILDDMFRFARKWPNTLIEFKTKSRNVEHIINSDVPRNIICSWSLNPDIIIQNEEHLTPGLSKRLDAARAVADRGIRIGFHLHPLIAYRGWRQDYSALIRTVIDRFHTKETVFVSLGTLTFPKPIIHKIRACGVRSKIHQMPMVRNPEGKLTYPEEIKKELFQHVYDGFSPWHEKVFFYLCMEEQKFWEMTFGTAYPGRSSFEEDLLDSAWGKLAS